MRRDSNDINWQNAKQVVYNRDSRCRLISILTVREFLVFKKYAHHTKILDPAHIIPVSKDSTIMYQPWNIVLLNRYSHEMLDNYKSPIDGHNITEKEVKYWWNRILKGNPKQYVQFIKSVPNYFEGEMGMRELEDKELGEVVGGRVPKLVEGVKQPYSGTSDKSEAPYELVLDK